MLKHVFFIKRVRVMWSLWETTGTEHNQRTTEVTFLGGD
jgi:hypothetical protein